MAYNADTETFEYTDTFTPDSSFVGDVFYDADDKELLVFLDSGHGYLYTGVPRAIFGQFNEGFPASWFSKPSVGRYYNSVIKRQYGPGTEVAWDPDTVYKVKAVPAPDMGPVTTTTTAPGSLSVTTDDSAYFTLTSTAQAPKEFLYEHKVDYTIAGGNKVYSATVEAGKGVFDGIDKIIERLEALGLDFEIKGVYVTVK